MVALMIMAYSLISVTLMCLIGSSCNSDGLEFNNPAWLYKRFRVNWFGAVMMALAFNILTLPLSICYWFYKLCTVGRKDKDEI